MSDKDWPLRSSASGKDYTACETCPLREPCYASEWNESMHPNPPKDPLKCTTAHTCLTCSERVLSHWKNFDEGRRLLLPEGCPRWKDKRGTATDCDACQLERDELDKAHPTYAAQLKAAGRFSHALFDAMKMKRQNPDNVEDLETRREMRESIMEQAQVSSAGALLQALSDPEKTARLERAVTLLTPLLDLVWDDKKFNQFRGLFEPERLNYHRTDWLDGLALAIERHSDDPSALVHEWKLVFTATAISRRAWGCWPKSRRRLVVRGWEKIARDWVDHPELMP